MFPKHNQVILKAYINTAQCIALSHLILIQSMIQVFLISLTERDLFERAITGKQDSKTFLK